MTQQPEAEAGAAEPAVAVPPGPLPAAKKKRGRESVGDMLRSLGLVLILVVIAWYLAQPSDGDEQSIRVVDPAGSIAQLQRDTPGVPAPRGAPEGWRATVDVADPDGLRLGYITPTEHYVEYAASVSSAADFLPEITGRGDEVGTFDVAGVPWRQFETADGATTLVRTAGEATVVVGGVRETGTLDELSDLAALVQP